MSEVQPVIPPRVKRLIERYDREGERKKDKAAKKVVEALAAGKNDKAIQLLLEAAETGEDAGLGVVGQRHVMAAELNAMLKPRTDRSPAAIEQRQRKLVESLTSGSRCSLTRAFRFAGYGKHRPSLDSLLASPSILDLFQKAVDEGRQLPMKYRTRIEAALEDRALGIV